MLGLLQNFKQRETARGALNPPAFLSIILRGGRMTKIAGAVASLAPTLGSVVSVLSAGASSMASRGRFATTVGILALTSGVGQSALAQDAAPALRFPAWVEAGGFLGTDETGRAEVALWAPLAGGARQLTFLEVRAKAFQGDILEANLALGNRAAHPSGFNLGVWGGLDVRQSEQDNTFWQVAGGLEALSERFDARINAYLPISDTKAGDGSATEVLVEGNNVFMIGGAEVAMRGVDAEIGRRFGLGRATLAGYVGGYYFDHSDALDSIAGGKARAEVFIDNFLKTGGRLTLDYEFAYDDVREESHQVGLSLRVPIGRKANRSDRSRFSRLTPQYKRMMDPIERDVNIVIGRSGREPVEDALTGVDFERVAHVNTGDTVEEVSEAAGPNSLLIQNANLTGPQALGGSQTLLGGGATIAVRGLQSGFETAFTAPGARVSIENPNNSETLTITGTNTHVAGLTLTGVRPEEERDLESRENLNESNHGIFVFQESFTGAFTQLSIDNMDGDGIHIGGPVATVSTGDKEITKSGLFENVTIENVGGDGIEIAGGGPRIDDEGVGEATHNQYGTFRSISISDVGGGGIKFGAEDESSESSSSAVNQTGVFTLVNISNVHGGNGVTFEASNISDGSGEANITQNGSFYDVTIENITYFGDDTVTGDRGNGISFTSTNAATSDSDTNNTQIGTFVDITINGVADGSGVSFLNTNLSTGRGNAINVQSGTFRGLTEISGVNGGSGVSFMDSNQTATDSGNAESTQIGDFSGQTEISGVTGGSGISFSATNSTEFRGNAISSQDGSFENVTISDVSGGDGVEFSIYNSSSTNDRRDSDPGIADAISDQSATFENVEILDVFGGDGVGFFVSSVAPVEPFEPNWIGDVRITQDGEFEDVTLKNIRGDGVEFHATNGGIDTTREIKGVGTATIEQYGTFAGFETLNVVGENSDLGILGDGIFIYSQNGSYDTEANAVHGEMHTQREFVFTDVTIGGAYESGIDFQFGNDDESVASLYAQFTEVTVRKTEEDGMQIESGKASEEALTELFFNGVVLEDVAQEDGNDYGVVFLGEDEITVDFTDLTFTGDIGSGTGTVLLFAQGVRVRATGSVLDLSNNDPEVCGRTDTTAETGFIGAAIVTVAETDPDTGFETRTTTGLESACAPQTP